MMTKLPEAQNLQELKEQNFSNLKDYDRFIKPLKKESCKVIDYGCSWGYNVFKLRNSGHDAIGFELSKPRATFGSQNLGVQIFTNQNDLQGEMDLVFSSHVIEHLTDIKSFVSLSRELLNQDGLFMAFCPNGSEEYRRREPNIWHVNWGFLHPNFLNIEFARFLFKNNPYLILTGDWDYDVKILNDWDQKSQVVGNADGKELLIIAKPNIEL
ncbi:class I SAM-dependent methyltransferase [Ekhidna sp. To15]|uniref:class I SAM-dependent methyltransferase n=1 Tax=Ekhidna sp. To15 TaxID=3395267 RepID=UPI003F527239